MIDDVCKVVSIVSVEIFSICIGALTVWTGISNLRLHPPLNVSMATISSIQPSDAGWAGHHTVYITTSPDTPGPNMAMGPLAVLAVLHSPQILGPLSAGLCTCCMLQCCRHRREMFVVDCTLHSCCMSCMGLGPAAAIALCATAVCGEWSWSVVSCHCTLGTTDSSRMCVTFLSWIPAVVGRWSCLNQIPVCSLCSGQW